MIDTSRPKVAREDAKKLGSPFAAAPLYRGAGWQGTLPLPLGQKQQPPPGFTGRDGRWPTDADVAAWQANGAQNIALRMPETVIGLDVDAYGDKEGDRTLAGLVDRFGPLPATWRSTSRASAVTGISFFRVPAGLTWPNLAGTHIETIRHGHRYAVAWPSLHPEGGQYRWYRPDGSVSADEVPSPEALPALPDTWVRGLTTLAVQRPKPREQMTEGDGRDPDLFSLLIGMHNHGASAENIRDTAAKENARFAVPMGAAQVEKIVVSVLGYDKLDSRYDTTDSGNADLFEGLFGDRVCWDHRRGRWLLWDGVRWAPDADGEVVRLARRAAQVRYAKAPEQGDQAEKQAKWALSSQSQQKIDAALRLARSWPKIKDAGDSWDADPWLLGVPNGVVDLRTGSLREARQDDRITMQAGVRFNPDAACPRWEGFFGEVFGGDGELIQFVRRAIGYSLTGDVREQAFFLLFGRGSNGKTTLLEALEKVLGDYALAAPFSTFTASRYADSGPSNDLARLDGARLVTAVEPGEGSTFSEHRIKALTGRDPITARFLRREFFTFRPGLKLWLAANYRPAVRDLSRGFWRRVRLIPFEVDFEASGIDDKTLPDKLAAEAEGILAWAVRAAVEWQREGLTTPAKVVQAVEDYREESNPATDYFAERLEDAPGDWTSLEALHADYLTWMANQYRGKEAKTKTLFGRLVEAKYRRAKRAGGAGFAGVRIKPGADVLSIAARVGSVAN
jgi:putative DNA primase/helicase